MNWLLLTVLAVTSRALYSIATKLLSSQVKVSSMTQSVLLTVSATFLTLIVSPFIGSISFHGFKTIWLTTIFMVCSLAVGNVLFFKGLEKLDAKLITCEGRDHFSEPENASIILKVLRKELKF